MYTICRFLFVYALTLMAFIIFLGVNPIMWVNKYSLHCFLFCYYCDFTQCVANKPTGLLKTDTAARGMGQRTGEYQKRGTVPVYRKRSVYFTFEHTWQALLNTYQCFHMENRAQTPWSNTQSLFIQTLSEHIGSVTLLFPLISCFVPPTPVS